MQYCMMSQHDEFLLTLMCLRLGLSNEDLADSEFHQQFAHMFLKHRSNL